MKFYLLLFLGLFQVSQCFSSERMFPHYMNSVVPEEAVNKVLDIFSGPNMSFEELNRLNKEYTQEQLESFFAVLREFTFIRYTDLYPMPDDYKLHKILHKYSYENPHPCINSCLHGASILGKPSCCLQGATCICITGAILGTISSLSMISFGAVVGENVLIYSGIATLITTGSLNIPIVLLVNNYNIFRRALESFFPYLSRFGLTPVSCIRNATDTQEYDRDQIFDKFNFYIHDDYKNQSDKILQAMTKIFLALKLHNP